ncbi:hypothetical protein [Methylobacter sp. S3L5C]|nr:hypothetical protein [Methylobacter sp. S3L5C]
MTVRTYHIVVSAYHVKIIGFYVAIASSYVDTDLIKDNAIKSLKE